MCVMRLTEGLTMETLIVITVNGMMEKVRPNATIAELIALFEEKDVHLIVELNGKFVYPKKYDTTHVSEGDRIEFINPNIGG